MRVRSLGLLAWAVPVFLIVSMGSSRASVEYQVEGSGQEGENVFVHECAGCHGPDGQGALEGPSLGSLLNSESSVSGVAEIVRSGYGDMDPFREKLSETQIQEVAAYVVSQFGTSGDVPEGGVLFRLNCAGCHGASGSGGALIYSDENAPSLMDVSTPLVSAATRGGPSTMPAYNQGALTDSQVAAIAAYVESLQSTPRPGGMEVPYHGPVTEGLLGIFGGLGVAILVALWMERGGRG